jgi:ATPase subunit of ABC transporter with duplicated ATPase domains
MTCGLAHHRGAAVIISHCRTVLDRPATHMLGADSVNPRKLTHKPLTR